MNNSADQTPPCLILLSPSSAILIYPSSSRNSTPDLSDGALKPVPGMQAWPKTLTRGSGIWERSFRLNLYAVNQKSFPKIPSEIGRLKCSPQCVFQLCCAADHFTTSFSEPRKNSFGRPCRPATHEIWRERITKRRRRRRPKDDSRSSRLPRRDRRCRRGGPGDHDEDVEERGRLFQNIRFPERSALFRATV